MAEVIELLPGEEPVVHERYALVVVSATPPEQGTAIDTAGFGQTFFVDEDERHVSLIVGRARLWADENIIARVYVRRDQH